MCLDSEQYTGPIRETGSLVYKLVEQVYGGVLKTPWKRVVVKPNEIQQRAGAGFIYYKHGTYPEGIHVFPTREAARKYKSKGRYKILRGRLIGAVVFRGSERRFASRPLVPVLVVTAVLWEKVVR